MTRECDGLFCREEDGKIVFHVFELKSGFNTEALIKAKNQITGSYLKLLHLLAPLQQFDMSRITMQGHIFIYEPTTELLSSLKLLSDPKARYILTIHDKKRYDMPAYKCSRLWHPLVCPDISLDLTELPFGIKAHTITL